MRSLRILIAVLIALAAGPAFAASSCTWEAIGSSSLSAKETCTADTGVVTGPVSFAAYAAGTTYAAGAQVIYNGQPYASLQASNTGHTPETSPTWWSLAGMSLSNATNWVLVVCAAGAAATVSDGAAVDFYYWDARVGTMAKSDISITVPTGTKCVTSKGDSPGWGIPNISRPGRLLPVPNAMAASDGGSLVVYLLASNASGISL